MSGLKLSTRLALGVFASVVGVTGALAQTNAGNVCGLGAQQAIHALTTDNTIFSFENGAVRATRINGIDGNLIGIDFRVSDGPVNRLYGLTDTGKLYRFSIDPASTPVPQLISTLTARFAGGFQALADFNPVLAPNANALRIIGSNDQNLAVVDSGGTLNATAVQTAVSYTSGDAAFGISPNLTAGAYDNNFQGAPFTTFYAIDYDLDTLVTIADRNASGSSNTGGGMLKTLGPIFDAAGNGINIAPDAGLDIVNSNNAVAVSGRTLYCVDLASVDPNLPVGSAQRVVFRPITTLSGNNASPTTPTGGFIDVAVFPFAAAATTADLAVAATDSPDPVLVGKSGATLTYQVAVNNLGPATASSVSLSGSQVPPASGTPPALTFISALPSQGSCTSKSTTAFIVSCTLGDIPSGAGAGLTITVRVTNPGTSNSIVPTISSSFSATSTVADPNTANNTAIAVTTAQF